MKLDISKEDIDFLKDLQHELNTQDTDGNAQPVFWGIMEKHEQVIPEGYGGYPVITNDDGSYTIEEVIQMVDEELLDPDYGYSDEVREEWKEVDKDWPESILDFLKEKMEWDNVYDVVYCEKQERLCTYTGAFLTKRAVQDYIGRYGYNHDEPRSYAMSAVRNPEFERLIKIVKNLKFEES